MMDYFDVNDNVKLLEAVIVDLLIYCGRRGRENMRDLKVEDFAATRDGDGNMYIYMVKDELTKNHQNDHNTAEGRMYARPDDHMCPVKTFMRYKIWRNPQCSALFQRPKRKIQDSVWYDRMAVGHKTLGSMIKTISLKAGLSKLYTNHSLQATAVSILDRAHFASRHIMAVTGHKAETSLKTCSGTTDAGTKKLLSDAISDNLCVGSRHREKPAALGKAPEPVESMNISDLPSVNEFDFLSDDLHPNEEDVVDQILSTISTGDLELENIGPKNSNNVQNTNITNCSSTSMPLMALPNITNYGQITINYNIKN